MRQVLRVKDGFAEERVKERSVVRLYHKEKELFSRNAKEGIADNSAFGVSPYPLLDEIRVPWYSRSNSYLAYTISSHLI